MATTLTTSAVSESAAVDAAVCLVALHEGFVLVLCGHAHFCKNCVKIVGLLLPVCNADTTIVMRVFLSVITCFFQA